MHPRPFRPRLMKGRNSDMRMVLAAEQNITALDLSLSNEPFQFSGQGLVANEFDFLLILCHHNSLASNHLAKYFAAVLFVSPFKGVNQHSLRHFCFKGTRSGIIDCSLP